MFLTLSNVCSLPTLMGQDTDRNQNVDDSASKPVGSRAMHDEDELAYCGVAAVEYVAQRLGVAPIKGVEYDRLRLLPVADLLDLRAVFEANGLDVASYEIDTTEQAGWDRLSSLIDSGSAQIILLVHAENQGANIEHFLVIEKLNGEACWLADPRSMSFFETTRSELFEDADSAAIQVVSRADLGAIYAPVSAADWLKWSIVPLMVVTWMLGWRLRLNG